MMNCRICSNNSDEIFSARILNKYNIKYFFCKSCNFLQTEEPYWLKEAYESGIGITDTGLLKRNNLFAKRTAALINLYYNKRKIFLDYAGGYGIFVRMMRDLGYEFYWADPYTENLLARGFEYDSQQSIELLTTFECFEHFNNPIVEIEKMLAVSNNILFSTRVFRNLPPKPEDWWYYSLESGQHISFYSVNTLKFIANKFGLHLNTDNRGFHMLSKKKINNILFNSIVKMSSFGLLNFLNSGLKSKTDLDHTLLTGKNDKS